MKKNIIMVLSVLIFMVTMIGCQAPVSYPNDSEPDKAPVNKELSDLTNVPYIGGSLIYNQSNSAASHLANGMIIPIRLGEVEPEYDEELGQTILSDVPENARYGYLYITSINNETINGYYKLYALDGSVVKEDSFSLTSDHPMDLDRDGDYDIIYTTPAETRKGLEDARYLTFISSEEEASTSMYSLLPEAFADNTYPSGIMGINPNGKLLLKAEEMAGGSRGYNGVSRTLSVSSANPIAVDAGDFIISGEHGTLAIVEQVIETRSGSDAVLDQSDENRVLEAMPLMFFDFEGTMAELEEQAYGNRGITEDIQAYNKKLAEMKQALNQYHKIQLLNVKGFSKEYRKGGSYVKLTFDDLKAHIGVKTTFSASWDRISGSASAVLFVEAGASVAGKGSINEDIWKQQLANLSTRVTVGPVVIGFSGILEMGVNAGVNTNEVKFGFKASAMYGGGAAAGANVKWRRGWFGIRYPAGINTYFRTNKVEQFNYTFTGTPVLVGTAHIKPYFSAGVKVDIYGTLYVQTDARVSLGPKLTGTVTPQYASIKAALELGVDVYASSGVQVLFYKHSFGRVKLLGFNKNLWEKEIYRRSFNKAPLSIISE